MQFMMEDVLKGDHTTRILNLGCGNGEIQERLYEAGYHNITNNDISQVVIEHLAAMNKYPHMLYQVMDVKSMTYPNESFDFVLDKSTIDALLCSDSPSLSVAKMTREVYRVLRPGGVYFVVSYGSPEHRMEHFEREHIAFDV